MNSNCFIHSLTTDWIEDGPFQGLPPPLPGTLRWSLQVLWKHTCQTMRGRPNARQSSKIQDWHAHTRNTQATKHAYTIHDDQISIKLIWPHTYSSRCPYPFTLQFKLYLKQTTMKRKIKKKLPSGFEPGSFRWHTITLTTRPNARQSDRKTRKMNYK